MKDNGGTAAAVRRIGLLPALTLVMAAGLLCTCPMISLAGPKPESRSAAIGKCDSFIRAELGRNATKGWSSVLLWIDGPLTKARREQLDALHVDIYRNLPVVSSIAARVPTRNILDVAELPFVKRLSADVDVEKHDEFTVGASGADTAFSQQKLTGDGLTVAILDSGVRMCSDLTDPGAASRIVAKVSFVQGDATTDDKCGHGTHIAGIIAGNGAASTGSYCTHTYYGIARRTDIANVRVLDGNGAGKVSNVIAGISWIVANKSKYNIRVLNVSFGHPVGESYTTDPLCRAVEAAWTSGIVVVCAAGNSGRLQDTTDSSQSNEGYGTAYGSITSPGNDPYVITVGAMKRIDTVRSDDRIATYSSRGPSRLDFVVKPDLVAPGNRVISLNAPNTYLSGMFAQTNGVQLSEYTRLTSGNSSIQYFRMSGTSMAAPVVSGAVALMLQANSTLSPDTVKARLMLSADKWTLPNGTADICTYGAGYLNIAKALACTYVASQPSLSPMLMCSSDGGVYLVPCGDVNGLRAIWGGFSTVESLRAIWGPALSTNSSGTAVLSSSTLWGLSLWSDKAVWGESSGAADLSMTAINGDKR